MDVWPFIPQVSVTERFEWNTEVISCKSAEQRICLRLIPRVTIKYHYYLYEQEIEAATSLARKYGADELLVPLWTDFAVVQGIVSDQTTISIDNTIRRFTAGGYVFLLGGSGDYETVLIDSVTDSAITLSTGVVNDYDAAYVMPCFPFFFSEAFQLGKYAGEYCTADASFLTSVDLGVVGADVYPTYNGISVMTDRSVVSSDSISETHTVDFSLFDNENGPVFYSKNHTYAVGASSLSWSLDDRTSMHALRQWFYDKKGKQTAFYVPRWTRDFVLSADVVSGNTTFNFNINNSFADSYTGPVCIAMTDGTLYYATINSWVGKIAVLSAAFTHSIDKDDVELICRMPLMRLDADAIEFDFGEAGSTTVKAAIIEVPD